MYAFLSVIIHTLLLNQTVVNSTHNIIKYLLFGWLITLRVSITGFGI